METYKTIQMAFANGKGDCFFKKDGQFIAVSRKDIATHNRLALNNWTMLAYHNVVEEAAKTDVTKAPCRPIAQEKTNPLKPIDNKNIRRSYWNYDIYEFSDADSGL